MKQVFFILLVIISIQGFSQSVEVPEIGLEVMTKDLGIEKINWHDAKKACDSLGDGWRLPSKDELKKIYEFKDKIGGFQKSSYWSSSEANWGTAFVFYFSSGNANFFSAYDDKNFVRAVRNLK